MPRVPQATPGAVKPGGIRAPYLRSPAGGINQSATYLQRAGAITASAMSQIAARAKQRADNSMVNGIMADIDTGVQEILLEAEQVKGTDALTDPSTTGGREDKRPITAVVEERISALINEQRAVPKTNDQLAAIDEKIPGIVNGAMLDAHRHEAKQQEIVHNANFDANRAAIGNRLARHARAGDEDMVTKDLADLDEATVVYLDSIGLDDTEKRNQLVVETRSQALTLAMKNALAEGRVSWVMDQYYGHKDAETGKRSGGLKEQTDDFGPSFTEKDKNELEGRLKSTSDKQEAYGHVFTKRQEQQWTPSEEVGGDQEKDMFASIDAAFPPGDYPEKNDTAKRRARQEILEHNAAVQAEQKRYRRRFFGFLKNGVTPDELEQLDGSEYITEDAWRAFYAWHDAELRRAAGDTNAPAVSDPDTLRWWANLSHAEKIEAARPGPPGPDGQPGPSDLDEKRGLLKPQDYEDRLKQADDLRNGKTPPNELEAAIRKKILTSQPDLDVSPTGGDKAIVDDWVEKIAAEIARMEADEGRGQFPRPRIYEETDKLLFSWQEAEGGSDTSLGWWLLSPIAYFGKRAFGGRDPETDERIFSLDAKAGGPADTSRYYKSIEEIPTRHVEIVAAYLNLDMTTPNDIEKNSPTIEAEYAQNYLYPLAREIQDPNALHLVNRIRSEDQQRVDRRVDAQADATDLSQAGLALEVYTDEEIEMGKKMVRAGGRIPSPATILDELQLLELRKGQKEFRELNPEADISDRELRYKLSLGYGHSEEAAEAHSGYVPRKSALAKERQGPRQ